MAEILRSVCLPIVVLLLAGCAGVFTPIEEPISFIVASW